MKLRELLDVAKRLRNIDRPVLRAAGLDLCDDDWINFRSDPIRWLTLARDQEVDLVASILERNA